MLVIKEAYITEAETIRPPVQSTCTINRILAICALALIGLGLCPALNTAIFQAASVISAR
jgi:hypothetical protein